MMENSTQAVPFASGAAFITLFRKSDGTIVDPPQSMAIEGIQDISWDNKNDLKELHGQGAYASRVGSGKKSLSLSMTVSELSGKQLNMLAYGEDVEKRQLKIRQDKIGNLIPKTNTVTVAINNSIQFNVARIDSNTSVTINGVSSTRFGYTNGIYKFYPENVNQTAVLSYVSNGIAITTTIKIPKSLKFDVKQFSSLTKITKGASTAPLTRLPFSYTADVPTVESYSASQNGVVVFNPSQAGTMTISHRTDGLNVVSYIATLPTADFIHYIDPPASSVWVSNVVVNLRSNTGAIIGSGAGLSVGDALTKSTTTASSGSYLVDAKGKYSFYSGDVGDVVDITYVSDYQFFAVVPPNSGTFTKDLGVRFKGGITLDRVALTSPLALLNNQYAVSDNGSYYFDQTNGGDTVYIDYQYEVAGTGQTITINNNKMGGSPILSVDILYEMDGEMMTASFESVKMKGTGIATKQDDFSPMKFEMTAFANKETGVVYTLSTTV